MRLLGVLMLLPVAVCLAYALYKDAYLRIAVAVTIVSIALMVWVAFGLGLLIGSLK